MFLLGLCLFLQQWWTNEPGLSVWVKSVIKVGLPMVILAFILFLPFYLKFQIQAQGLGIAGSRTDLYYLVVIFGAFFTILIPALVGTALQQKTEKGQKAKTKRSEAFECVNCGKESSGKKFCGYCGGELLSPSNYEITPIPHEETRSFLSKLASGLTGTDGSQRGWITLGIVILALLLLNLDPVNFGTFGFALVMIFLCIISLGSSSVSKEMVFTILLVLIGFILMAGCEVFYMKDLFSGGDNHSALHRMNTVFKFHYQVWIFFSIASGPFLKWIIDNQWPQWAVWKKTVWAVVAGFAFLGAFLYPVMALQARLQGTSADLATMDGAVSYEHQFPADYQAAMWIKDNIKPSGGQIPVILEAWGRSYHQEEDRLATLNGIPNHLGLGFSRSAVAWVR